MNDKLNKINVLSAGAIEPGLVDSARAFGSASGLEVAIQWATTPMIRQRMTHGVSADLLIVPTAAAEDFAAAGKVDNAAHVDLGRVGVGIGVRKGAPIPDVSTTQALAHSLLDADSVVINRASSGIYMETLLARLGVKDAIENKLLRIIDGPQMMQHLIHGKGREFGFCASVEIVLYHDRGMQLAGMLPEDIQYYTPYTAVPMRNASNPRGASAFLAYLTTEESRRHFRAYGIT